MFVSKVFSFFFVCLLAACGNSASQNGDATSQTLNINNQQIKSTNQNQQKEITELSLNMKKSGCFGECPIYDLAVQSDGKVIFDGKKYTKKIGKVESRLDKEKIKELINEIEKTKFFSLDNAYNYDSKNCPVSMSDLPNITLYIKLNGEEKTINHDWGCWKGSPITTDSNGKSIRKETWSPTIFPQELYNLEDKIDEIAGTKRWIGERKY